MDTKPLYICDIDGTIANLTHRLYLIEGEKPNWPAFYEACDEDLPIPGVIKVINHLRDTGAEIWFFTGRMETVRHKTVIWLAEHLGYFNMAYVDNRLVMRPDKDTRHDDVIKLEMLNNMLECDRNRLVAVFDDRQRVVDMWRANGVTCLQVAKGDF